MFYRWLYYNNLKKNKKIKRFKAFNLYIYHKQKITNEKIIFSNHWNLSFGFGGRF